MAQAVDGRIKCLQLLVYSLVLGSWSALYRINKILPSSVLYMTCSYIVYQTRFQSLARVPSSGIDHFFSAK